MEDIKKALIKAESLITRNINDPEYQEERDKISLAFGRNKLDPKNKIVLTKDFFKWLTKEAEKGNSYCQYFLSFITGPQGKGADLTMNYNVKESLKWLRKSSETNFMAAYYLATAYTRDASKHKLKEDSKESFKILLRLKEKYGYYSQNLAKAYQKGYGTDKDPLEALKVFIMSFDERRHIAEIFNMSIIFDMYKSIIENHVDENPTIIDKLDESMKKKLEEIRNAKFEVDPNVELSPELKFANMVGKTINFAQLLEDKEKIDKEDPAVMEKYKQQVEKLYQTRDLMKPETGFKQVMICPSSDTISKQDDDTFEV